MARLIPSISGRREFRQARDVTLDTNQIPDEVIVLITDLQLFGQTKQALWIRREYMSDPITFDDVFRIEWGPEE